MSVTERGLSLPSTSSPRLDSVLALSPWRLGAARQGVPKSNTIRNAYVISPDLVDLLAATLSQLHSRHLSDAAWKRGRRQGTSHPGCCRGSDGDNVSVPICGDGAVTRGRAGHCHCVLRVVTPCWEGRRRRQWLGSHRASTCSRAGGGRRGCALHPASTTPGHH